MKGGAKAGAGPGRGWTNQGSGWIWAGTWAGLSMGGASPEAGPGQDLCCPGSWRAPARQVSLATRRPFPGHLGPRVRRAGLSRLGDCGPASPQALRSEPGGGGVPSGLSSSPPRAVSPQTLTARVSRPLRACVCACLCLSPACAHQCVCVDVCVHKRNCACG